MYILHHNEGRFAGRTSCRLFLERMLVKSFMRYILDCHMDRYLAEDARKLFPNTTVERYDLPFVFLLLRPHINVVRVKD